MMREMFRKFNTQPESMIIMELWVMLWVVLGAIPSLVLWWSYS